MTTRTAAAATAARQLAADRAICLRCHATAIATTPAGLPFHADAQAPCVRCHRYHEPDVVQTGRGTLSLASLAGVDREHCRPCHGAGARRERLSAGHLAAAAIYHGNAAALAPLSPSAACRACHDRDTASSDWLGAVEGQAIAFAAHSSHPTEIRVRPGQPTAASWIREDIDPRLVLPGGRIECVTCHDLTSGTPDLLVAFERPRDLCLGCHLLKQEAPQTITVLDLTAAQKSPLKRRY